MRVVVHPRVVARHPELTEADVLNAWFHCIRSAPRVGKKVNQYVAVGIDLKGRLIEIVGVRSIGGSWILFHAMRPPSKKTLRELGL